MGAEKKVSYATRAQIARAVQAARANGVVVATLEMQRDGTVRVSSTPIAEQKPKTLFDQLEAEGRL